MKPPLDNASIDGVGAGAEDHSPDSRSGCGVVSVQSGCGFGDKVWRLQTCKRSQGRWGVDRSGVGATGHASAGGGGGG